MNLAENTELEKELKILSDTQLLEKTFDVAKKEQQTTLSLLFHLKEVNERRSYALLGCASLWEYAIKILGYGESGASERINAMRLLAQVPGVKERLETGKMTLTTASQVQRFFQAERKVLRKNYSISQKLQVLDQIDGCSKREVEQKLVVLSPKLVKLPSQVEKTRILPESKTELKFVADADTMDMIKRVREIKGAGFLLSEVFKQSLKSWLAQNDPEQKYSKRSKKSEKDLARKTNEATYDKRAEAAAGLTRKTGEAASDKLAAATESLFRKTHQTVAELATNRAGTIQNLANETVENFSNKSKVTGKLRKPKKTQTLAKVHHTQKPNFSRQTRQTFSGQIESLSEPKTLKGSLGQKTSRYIPIAVRRKIYQRAKGQCEYKSPLNGKRCGSKTRLQWDHIHPHALGGENLENNIALLCFSHNQRRAIEIFGRQK